MVRKILKNKLDSRGITIAELLAVIAIIIMITSIIMVFVAPQELQARTRDNKRISDLSALQRALIEYSFDNKAYPDAIDTPRFSNELPAGNYGPHESPVDGWIDVNLSSYLTKVPIDPINTVDYKYSYIHTAHSFELNAVLENQTDYMILDGGNNDYIYEVGNDLTLFD